MRTSRDAGMVSDSNTHLGLAMSSMVNSLSYTSRCHTFSLANGTLCRPKRTCSQVVLESSQAVHSITFKKCNATEMVMVCTNVASCAAKLHISFAKLCASDQLGTLSFLKRTHRSNDIRIVSADVQDYMGLAKFWPVGLPTHKAQ